MSPDEMRKRAEECAKLAQMVSDPEARRSYGEAAKLWLRMAGGVAANPEPQAQQQQQPKKD